MSTNQPLVGVNRTEPGVALDETAQYIKGQLAEAAASPVGDGGGAIAPAALHFGERLIGRSSRSGSGVVVAKNAGQPAVDRPPCANQLWAVSPTSTGLSARAVVVDGYREGSSSCPIPCS
jgi:hypothetical protein